MDNLAQQIDEIEALVAIYNNDWHIEDVENRCYSIRIPDGQNFIKLYLKLPMDYPTNSPPLYEISAPHLDLRRKNHLGSLLDEVYLTLVGEAVIYQWIERIREELQSHQAEDNNDEVVGTTDVADINSLRPLNRFEECPAIHHGEVIVDRKSSFQGHAATVFSVDQVKQVLKSLLSNRKIEQATHNIYAYRIYHDERKTFIHDCDDDGESQAGGRLLHLLEIVEAKNVLVVVSRWYGGVHLGADRFRHINNAARRVLQSAELIPRNGDKKK